MHVEVKGHLDQPHQSISPSPKEQDVYPSEVLPAFWIRYKIT